MIATRLRAVPSLVGFAWRRSSRDVKGFGLVRGVRYAWFGLQRGEKVIRVAVPGTPLELWCRLGRSQSDISTLLHVFSGGYEFGVENPRVIVDAGANAGYSAVWFARRYPNARVLAIEPDAANVALLRRNVADYPNVEVIEAALMNFDGPAELVDPGHGPWGIRVQPKGARWSSGEVVGTIECVSPTKLFAQREIETVGYLKVDIEGSEVDLFSGDTSWMNSVESMAIELHDRFRSGCSTAFRRATQRFEWEERRGEDTFVAVKEPART